MNIAGMMAKYLATSLAIENVVSAPRVISSCLPISTISISLVGFESRSTMLPASLAAVVPVFMATPTSACASAGASLVPSPVIATSLPSACSRLISAILSSGVASARKSSTPASLAIAAAVSGLSPVIITVRMPIARKRGEALPHAALDDVLEVDRRRAPGARSATTSGVPPAAGDALDDRLQLGGDGAPPLPVHVGDDGVGRALADLAPVEVDARHARLRGERARTTASCRAELAPAQAVALLGEHDDRAALGRLVGQRGQLRGLGQLALARRRPPAGTRSPGGCRA